MHISQAETQATYIHFPKQLDLFLPHLIDLISPHPHLKEQFPVRPGMREAWSVVVFIQHGDMSGTGGAAGRRTPVLYYYNKLVTGLLLSVQGEAGADLT